MDPVVVSTVRVRGEAACVDVCRERLVLGSGDGTVALLRWQAGLGWLEVAERRRAHRYGVTAAVFSPAGQLLATAGVDGVARVWSALDLAARRELSAPQAAAVRALVWVCGTRLVAGHEDGYVRVWRVRRGGSGGSGGSALLAALRPHDDAVRGLALLADNAMLLTAAADGVLKVFNFDQVCRAGLEDSVVPVALLWEDGAHDLGALCADGAGDVAATGGHDGRVRLWRVTEEKSAREVHAAETLRGHAGAVTAVRCCRTVQHRGVLASGSLDRTARLWCVSTGACLRVWHAHNRYLTCIALSTDLTFIVTGSNDKTVRTWSIGDFSLDSSLEPRCSTLSHFGLGDLEGIAPLEDTEDEQVVAETAARAGEARRVWAAERAHAGPINCIAATAQHLATCSSDGSINIYTRGDETLRLHATVRPHDYPALAVDFDASGRLLLSAGLDGRAVVLDVESGVEVASVCASAWGAGGAGSAGGGGVRDARFAPTPPLRALLATDDGVAVIWTPDKELSEPSLVLGGLEDSATCCAWSCDGRAAAVGAATGGLSIVATHAQHTLCYQPDAHDLGVLSCDFASAPGCSTIEDTNCSYMLATGGRDALLKIWRLTLTDDERGLNGSLVLCRSVNAHEGAVQCVRWGAGTGAAALASGGADRWARVWSVHMRKDNVEVRGRGAAAARGAGGAAAVALPAPGALALAELDGSLALWRLPINDDLEGESEEEASPRCWEVADVVRWLHEYVTKWPGSQVSPGEGAELERRVRAGGARGARLLDEPLSDVMAIFGLHYDKGAGEELVSDTQAAQPEESCDISESTRRRLLDELRWLRRPHYDDTLAPAPHALRCPLTHAALREAVRAPDGFSYDRSALVEHRLAVDTPDISPMTQRRLHSTQLSPNYRLREQLREFCKWNLETNTTE